MNPSLFKISFNEIREKIVHPFLIIDSSKIMDMNTTFLYVAD